MSRKRKPILDVMATDYYNDTVMEAMSEGEFQTWVIATAKIHGWDAELIYHTYDSKKSTPGWPDLVLAKPPRVFFWELKSMDGDEPKAQKKWIRTLKECGQAAEFIYPCDWRKVEEELSRSDAPPKAGDPRELAALLAPHLAEAMEARR